MPVQVECAVRAATGLLVCAVVLACGDASGGGDAVVRRDSAGVEIVDNRSPEWRAGEGWTLAAEPLLRIGVADGDSLYQFHDVRSAILLDNGRIAVANGGTSTIRLFAADGTFQHQAGGRGGGPGEFQRLGPLGRWDADTIAAYDFSARRLTVLSPDMSIARTVSFDAIQTPVPIGRPFRLPDGSYIAGGIGFSSQQLSSRPETGLMRPDAPIFHIAADASSADTLGMFPGMEIAMRTTDRGYSFGPPPFGRNLHYFVHDGRLHVGTAESMQVSVYSSAGRPLRIIRGPAEDLTITQEAIDRHHAAVLEVSKERGFDPAVVEAGFEDEILPPARAAYSQMLVDDEGNLWLGMDGSAFEPPRSWTVFDADGRMLGGITVPAGFRIQDVRQGRVLGTTTDELDVQYVEVFALERR